MSNITEQIENLNFYGWSENGMKENPENIPIEDVFILRSDVIAAIQNKVSDREKDRIIKLKDNYIQELDGVVTK